MRRLGLWILCGLLVGCAPKEPPLPPVPPVPSDLSPTEDTDGWTLPQIVELPPLPEPPAPRVAADNELLYPYEVGREYPVPVPLGWPADIVLEPGEKVHKIVGGDRSYLMQSGTEGGWTVDDEPAKWEITEGVSESELTPISHIFFVASHVGQKMGVVVATSRRTYYLTLTSVQRSKIRTVSWTYPVDLTRKAQEEPKEAGILPDPTQPKRFHIGYEMQYPDPPPDWLPRSVLDDGQKTYLLFDAPMLYQDAPLVREMTVTGPSVVNVRQTKNVIVIDKLVQRLELRYGTGEYAFVVTITRGALRTIACPMDIGCPTWPTL